MAEDGEHIGQNEKTLYTSPSFKIVTRTPTAIPVEEGLSFHIKGLNDAIDTPREVFQRYTIALGAAKLTAESAHTQDFWANTRVENGNTVSVYGRVPENEDSWRKPADTRRSSDTAIEERYDTERLKRLMTKYIPKWETLTEHMALFANEDVGENVRGEDKMDMLYGEMID